MTSISATVNADRAARGLRPLVHLQGVGAVEGTPAGDLTVGMVTMWNTGSTSEVVAVEPIGSSMVAVTYRGAIDYRGTVGDTVRRHRRTFVVGTPAHLQPAEVEVATGSTVHELTPDGPACGIEHVEAGPWLALDVDPEEVTCAACRSGEPSNEIDDNEDDDEPDEAGPFVCADCGTGDATSYVVTFLDGDQEDPTGRTEVCLPCHQADTLAEADGEPAEVSPELAAALLQLARQVTEVTEQTRDRSGDYLAALDALADDLDALAAGRLPAGIG